jgi:hypothetical protein
MQYPNADDVAYVCGVGQANHSCATSRPSLQCHTYDNLGRKQQFRTYTRTNMPNLPRHASRVKKLSLPQNPHQPPLPSPKIHTLPQELFDLIISHLAPSLHSPKQPSLLALSLTSKPLHTACLPHIYTSISIRPFPSSPAPRVSSRLKLLLRTLSPPGNLLGPFIRHLALSSIHVHEVLLDQILTSTPHLTHLSVHFLLQFFADRRFIGINSARLSSALSLVATSLTSLEIRYTLVFRSFGPKLPGGHEPPAIPHTPCSFQHLACLTHLSVPLSVILGWTMVSTPQMYLHDVLPNSLESLHVGKDVWWQFRHEPAFDPITFAVATYVHNRMWKQHTPKLRSVSAHLSVWHPNGIEKLVDRRKALKRVLDSNGLEYVEELKKLVRDNVLGDEGETFLRENGVEDGMPSWEVGWRR